MLKFAVILLLACLLFRWAVGKWPWQLLSGQPARSQALGDARKLLGVRPGASRQEIVAAHKRIIAVVHPDRGGSSAQVHEANDARDLLLAAMPDNGLDSGPDDRADGPSRD